MLVDTTETFTAFLDLLARESAVAFDTETTGLGVHTGDRICGASFYLPNAGAAFYLPVRHAREVPKARYEWQYAKKFGRETWDDGAIKRRVRIVDDYEYRDFPQLKPVALAHVFDVIRRRNIDLRCHNAKFDMHMVLNEGIAIEGINVFDTMVMGRLANSAEQELGLKKLGTKYIDANADAEEKALRKWLQQQLYIFINDDGVEEVHYDWTTPAEMCDYAEKDAVLTDALYRLLLPKIAESNQRDVLLREVELLPVLLDMERYGIAVDLDYCRAGIEQLEPRLNEVAERAYALAGRTFTIASNPELGKAFNAIGVKSPLRTQTGKDSWAKDAFALIEHPLTDAVTEWRALHRMKASYLENFIRYGIPIAGTDYGLIHMDMQQVGASTGRTSCQNPNLQNQTRDEVDGLSVRRCFVPRPGHAFLFVDWSQMEVCLLADEAGETDLIDAIKHGQDVHSLTAMRISGVMGLGLCNDRECKTFKVWRQRAKTITFSILYGAGAAKIAKQLGIADTLAAELRAAFWKAYPKIAAFARRVQREVELTGATTNRFGRRYTYHWWEDPQTGRGKYLKAYAALNHRIQGAGADMAKIAMVRVARGLTKAGFTSRLVAMVHDELVLECPLAEVERVARKVVRTMEGESYAAWTQFRVPIRAEASISYGPWSEKQPLEVARAA